MVIREMNREECLHVLAGAKLARLACANENQPYVVPVYLAYHEASECLYGFTTPGRKIEWMRANPLVCVEVDEITAYDDWVSVIAKGRYEELAETPGSDDERFQAERRPHPFGEPMPPWAADNRQRLCADERERACQALQTHPMWWEPGNTAWTARAHRDPAEAYIPVYYRILIDHVTGRKATPDVSNAISSAVQAPHAGKWSWLLGTRTHVNFHRHSRNVGNQLPS